MASYTVVRSDGFVAQLTALGIDDERLDPVLDAVEDALARNPLAGREVVKVDGGARMLVGYPLRSNPLAFYYLPPDGVKRVVLIGVRMLGM